MAEDEPTTIRDYRELVNLPGLAVVEDRSNQVWQQSFGKEAWLKPGDAFHYPLEAVELPARLLDDGL